MSNTAANADDFAGSKEITAAERFQALLLAEMNEERAGLCADSQPGLRKMFEMNTEFLRSIAK